MRILLSITVLLVASSAAYAQASDFITVKKRNNRTLASYFPGTPIAFQTVYKNFISGIVEAVRNDSVFVKQYDIRQVPNQWGVGSVDTLGSTVTGTHYKDIEQMVMNKRTSFGYVKNGMIFIIGGTGYALLNLINGKYLNESITNGANMKSLGTALGVAGAGLLLNRLHKFSDRNGKRYTVKYVRMDGPQQLKPF